MQGIPSSSTLSSTSHAKQGSSGKITAFFKSAPSVPKAVPAPKLLSTRQSTLQSFFCAPRSAPAPPLPAAVPPPFLPFSNPHNLCYAVSVQQVVHYCASDLPDPGQIGSLLAFHAAAQLQHSQGASLRIDGFPTLLQLQPTWLFANAQQDAVEYFSNLCQADLGTLQPVPWLERRADAIIAQGLSPLLLPVPPGGPT